MPLLRRLSLMVPAQCTPNISALVLSPKVSFCHPIVFISPIGVIVRANLAPAFGSIPAYTRPPQPSTTITHVYNLYPMILTSSNAQAACARDPPLNLDTSAAPPSVDSFYPILLPNPPSNGFCHLTHQQQFAGLNDAAQLSNGPFVIESSICTQICAYYITFHK